MVAPENSIATRNASACPSATRLLLVLALAAPLSCAERSQQPAANLAPTPAPPVTQAPGSGDGAAANSPAVLSGAPSVTPAVAPGAALSTPSPFALPCTADANCLTHRCNVAAQKCAWPCQTDNDCMPGNACIAPTCLPKLQ